MKKLLLVTLLSIALVSACGSTIKRRVQMESSGKVKTETLVFRFTGAPGDVIYGNIPSYPFDADVYITGVSRFATLLRADPTLVDTTRSHVELSTISWSNANHWPPNNAGYRAAVMYFGLDYLNANGYRVKKATLHARPNYQLIDTAADAAHDSLYIASMNLGPQSAVWRQDANYSPNFNYANSIDQIPWPVGMTQIFVESFGTAGAAYNGVDYLEYEDAPLDVTDIAKAASNTPGDSWGGLMLLNCDANAGFRSGFPRATGYSQSSFIVVEAVKITSASTQALQRSAGIPGGGWLHGGAIAHQSNVMAVGADVSGCYASEDGGASWALRNQGLMNSDSIDNTYLDEVVAVKNSYFEGFIGGTYGGIYKAPIVYGRLADWETMTPTTDPDYVATVPVTWNLVEGWLDAIGFSAISWDGTDQMVAAAGKYRWDRDATNILTTGAYPTGYISGGPAGGPWSLFKYDFSAGVPKWEPWGLFVEADGHIRDVSVANVGGTLYALCAAAASGPKLYNGTSYIDLAARPWNDYSGTPLTINWSPDSFNAYDDRQCVDGLFLTEDGTAYAALRNQYAGSDVVSGLFVYADVTNTTTGSWEWVGDATVQSGVNKTMHDIGYGGWEPIPDTDPIEYTSNTYPNCEWAYINVVRGVTSDKLFLTARQGGGALSTAVMTHGQDPRTVTWAPKMQSYNAPMLWPMNTWFDNNVVGAWGGAIYEVSIDPNDQDHLLLHPNAKLYRSSDGGDSWTRSDGILKDPSLELFTSTGYDESCMDGLVVGSDGTIYYSAADLGIYSTVGNDWDWLEKNMPTDLAGSTIDPCPSTSPAADWWDDDRGSPNTETGFSVISHNFNGWQGSDLIFHVMGDVVQGGQMNKLFAFYDLNQTDGDMTKEWYHLTRDVVNLDRYQFLSNSLYANEDGTELFAAYLENSASLCATVDTVSAGCGVLQFSYQSGTGLWTTTDHPRGGDWPDIAVGSTSALGHPEAFTVTVVGDRLFVGLRQGTTNGSNNGGVLYKDLPSGAWTVAYGFDVVGGSRNGDVKNLQTDGSIMYMLTRGGASFYGALWRCDDPLTAPTVWTQLCNVDNFDNLVPGVDETQPLMADRWNAEPYWANALMFDGGAMLIDPNDNQKVYFTQTGAMQVYGGVWHYDGHTDTFRHLYPDHPTNAVGPSRGSFAYSDAFNPPRIIFGTHCAGPYWFNYPGDLEGAEVIVP